MGPDAAGDGWRAACGQMCSGNASLQMVMSHSSQHQGPEHRLGSLVTQGSCGGVGGGSQEIVHLNRKEICMETMAELLLIFTEALETSGARGLIPPRNAVRVSQSDFRGDPWEPPDSQGRGAVG